MRPVWALVAVGRAGLRHVVIRHGAKLNLPAGADWTHAWSGVKFAGGQRIVVDAPLEQIPVFVRGGNMDIVNCFSNLYAA